MSWVIEGFDRATEVLAERIELPSNVTDAMVAEALGNPAGVRLAAWPITREMISLVELVTGKALNQEGHDYFVEYQVTMD